MFTPTIELVHSDSRGEMYAINLPGDKELILIRSDKGSLRGGHSHDVDETVVILTGKMKYHKQDKKGSYAVAVKDGDASFNPAGLVHMGEFLEDTWLIEWKIDTDKNSWHNTNDLAWRERVTSNAKDRVH